jgi:putative phosphonate metabolism protein
MMRYAIYFLPSRDTPFWRFGASVLGYDAYTQENVPFPEHPLFGGLRPPAWISQPQAYGFHATLKAPFELARSATEQELHERARQFARRRRSFVVPALEVKVISRFVALLPAAPCAQLAELARDCVRCFEPLRAPIQPVDRQRRLGSRLTARQIANLELWGYPHVMEDFQFHMTLAGPLDPKELPNVLAVLEAQWATVSGPMPIDAIAVVVQPARDARFRVVGRYSFN